MQLVALTKRSCAESDRHRPVASTRLRPVVLAVAAVFAGPAAAQVPPIYIAQKINTPPDSIVGPSGGSVLNSFGVNDSSVIGAMQYFGGPIVTWQNRVVHSLPSATGRALNNAQDIVGSARVDTVNGVVSVAMKWTPGHSGVTVLSPVDSDGRQTTGVAQAINDAGWIVGQNSLPGEGFGVHPVMWSPQGTMTTLGAGWNPVALNEDRHVVGSSFAAGVESAVLWRPGVGLTTLSLASISGTGSRALDINEAGSIAGFGYGSSSGAYYTPVVWSANTAQTLSVPGSFSIGATASAINDDGWVAGTGYSPVTGFGPTFTSRSDPLLWAGAGAGPVKLSSITLMDLGNGQRGLMSAQDFIYIEAVDINSKGQVLVNTVRLADNPNPYFTGRFEPYILGRAESYLLSECIRCGQIKPNPNPEGEVLDVGPDWIDAFNHEAFVNRGRFTLSTALRNERPGSFANLGTFEILSGGVFDSTSRVTTESGAQMVVRGELLVSGGGMRNSGEFVIDGGSMTIEGDGMLNTDGGVFRHNSGELTVRTNLNVAGQATFVQAAGGHVVVEVPAVWSFVDGEGILGGSNENRGRVLVSKSSEGLGGAVSVSGSLTNRSGASVSVEARRLEVNGRFQNDGLVSIENDAFFVINGGAARFSVARSGLFEASTGTTLDVFSGGTFESEGNVRILGKSNVRDGTISAGGVFRNAGVMSVVSDNSSVLIPESSSLTHNLENLGRIELEQGAQLDIRGRFENHGTVVVDEESTVVNRGSVRILVGGAIRGEGTYEQLSGTTVVLGSLDVWNISILGGTLSGTGYVRPRLEATIGFLEAEATVGFPGEVEVDPGQSPGTLTFGGSVRLENAYIKVEIDDYQHYDRLVIDGNLTVNQARMKVFLAEGYAPDLNDRFDWLSTSGTVTGRENLQIELPNNVPAGWTTQIGEDGNLTVWNDSAVDLFDPFFTTYVPEGMLAFIDLSRQGLTEYSATERFVIEGQLALFSGSTLRPDHGVEIASTGRMTSRGTIVVDANGGVGGFVNEGRFENRVGGVFLNDLAGRQLVNRARFDNYGQFENRATVQNDAGATFQQGGEFVNAPGAKIENEGRFVVSGRVTNDQAEINNAGQFEITDTGRVEGQGTYWQLSPTASTVVDGRLEAGDLFLYAGRLSGHGTVASPRAFLGDFGAEEPLVVLPGGEFSVGTLTLEGQASAASTRFVIDIAGAEHYDRLGVKGDIFFHAGEVAFVLLDSYVPTIGQRFDWLKLANFSSFYTNEEVLGWTVSQRRADGSLWEFGGSSGFAAGAPVHFTFDGTSLVAAPVPEPATWALMLGGLAFVAVTACRRQSLTWNTR